MSGTKGATDLFDGSSASKTVGQVAAKSTEEFTLEQLRAAGEKVAGALVAPGQISEDECGRYFVRIHGLFSSVPVVEFTLALFAWGCLEGTGANTDYANAQPLVVGGVSVDAVKFAGGIVPVDDRGLLRKFFSTKYEKVARGYMDVIPGLRDKLAARAAKAGDPQGDPYNYIDFVKGVSAASKGSAGARVLGKDALLRRRGTGPAVSAKPVPEVKFLDGGSNGGGLY